MPHTTFMQVCTGIAPWDAGNDPGAAWCKTWLLIKLTLENVVFLFILELTEPALQAAEHLSRRES